MTVTVLRTMLAVVAVGCFLEAGARIFVGRQLVKRPFKGAFFYEWQIASWYIQLRRRDNAYPDKHRLLAVHHDPYWWKWRA